MLNVHTGGAWLYRGLLVPYLVQCRRHCVGTGQLPKFEERPVCKFRIRTTTPFYLIPTAEVPVTNIVRERNPSQRIGAAARRFVCPHALFPLRSRFLRQGHARHDSPAPVREGRTGADYVEPADSYAAHEELTAARGSRAAATRLELPYRVVTLCSGDTSGSARHKTYDHRGVAAEPGRVFARYRRAVTIEIVPGPPHESPLA